ncbi:MAG: DNA ligase D [Xanthomonadales bacterium]|nr:DNA ligase D [Xanthomonadales bacterium]
MSLAEYSRKRDFERSPEPARGGERGRRFVVQLHHASHRHFDFRLELDGALKSWAVPKGPSFDPKVKRMAIQVEDHPLAYAGFEGDIPQGEYGAGHVDIFDTGTWEPIGSARAGLARGELKFILHGDVLRGSWVLVRTGAQGKKPAWLLIKHVDDYAGPRDADDFVDAKTQRPLPLRVRRGTWAAMDAPAPPRRAKPPRAAASSAPRETIRAEPFAPELCKPATEAPIGDGWLHEVKWDGYRLLATVVRGKTRLWSRNGIDWTTRLLDIARAVESLGLRSARIDGELLAADGKGGSFAHLQRRLSDEPGEPLVYMMFDLVHADGRSLRDVPLLERKRVLKERFERHPDALLRWSEHHVGDGADVYAQAKRAGLEGIVSKRVDSPYRAARSGDWLKLKIRPSVEYTVIGYTEPKGRRAGFGALLLGEPDESGGLAYAGRVGSGFDDAGLVALQRRLAALHIDHPAAAVDGLARSDRERAHWVEPRLVAEVFHHGRGAHGLLRQASFKGLREDQDAASTRRVGRSGRMKTRDARTARPALPSAGIEVTHPQRVVFPAAGFTKGDVVDYYRAVAPRMLPGIAGRPLSVLRCPDGVVGECFFQKHAGRGWGAGVATMRVREAGQVKAYFAVDSVDGLIELVQMNALEFHVGGCAPGHPDRAARLVFDLDPGERVGWAAIVAGARIVRRHLAAIGLESFVRTSGGKGLHVVVPIHPAIDWTRARAFARGVAEALAELEPERFVSVAGARNRRGRIFIDWLRNGRSATSIAAYSLRARASAGVAMPVAWSEIARLRGGDHFGPRDALQRLARRRSDPWHGIDDLAQALPAL